MITETKTPRGFAGLDPALQKEIARRGGVRISQNREHMSRIGKLGGAATSSNREHMREIGKRGGPEVGSGAQSHIMELLKTNPEVSASQIESFTGNISRPTILKALKALTARGVVVKTDNQVKVLSRRERTWRLTDNAGGL